MIMNPEGLAAWCEQSSCNSTLGLPWGAVSQAASFKVRVDGHRPQPWKSSTWNTHQRASSWAELPIKQPKVWTPRVDFWVAGLFMELFTGIKHFLQFLKLRHILQKSNIYIIMWVNEFFDNCKHSCKPPPKSRYNVSFSSGRCLVSLFQSLCPSNLGRPLFWFLLPGFVSFVLGIMQCALVFLHCVSEIHLCCSNSSHLGDGFLLGLQE